MNEKFFSLPEEKQRAIINAGYRVFSQNSYRKSPVSEIAETAGISKSLLFHYFRNKKELYLFLWENCAQVTHQYMEQFDCYRQTNLFEAMTQGLRAKVYVMRRYPDLGSFAVRAYCEKDPEVSGEIQKSAQKYGAFQTNVARLRLDAKQFIPGLDLELMYQDMYWAAEGYLWEKTQQGSVDADQMERDFERMIAFWKRLYLRKEDTGEGGQEDADSGTKV